MSQADKQSILQALSSCEYGDHRFSDHSWDPKAFSIYFSKRSGEWLLKDLSIRASYSPIAFHFASNNKILYSSPNLDAVVRKVHDFEGVTLVTSYYSLFMVDS